MIGTSVVKELMEILKLRQQHSSDFIYDFVHIQIVSVVRLF